MCNSGKGLLSHCNQVSYDLCLCCTRLRYQVRVYRTIGSLVPFVTASFDHMIAEDQIRRLYIGIGDN